MAEAPLPPPFPEARQAEVECARLARRLTAVLEGSTQGIFGSDSEGRLTFINPAGARLFGASPEALQGRPVETLAAPPSAEAENSLAQVLAARLPIQSQRMSFQRGDGTAFVAELSAVPLEEGGAVFSFTDLSAQEAADSALRQAAFELELKNAELADARDEALAASRLKSEFLANLSHEIRTPMNAVLGMAALLARTRLDEEQRGFLETIGQSGELLLRLLNDLLDFSKLEARRLAPDPTDFDPRIAMEEATALFAGQAAKKGLYLACDLDPALPVQLHGDALRLRQVATNLLSNALKFTDRGGVVLRLRWLPGPERLRLEVEDSGIGIPAGAMDRIFHPFTQADGTTTRRYGGTGLGLSICRDLVELLGGTLGTESQEGSGSRFWAELPMRALPGDRTPTPPPRLAGLTVRIALPPGPAREALSHLLQGLGLEPREQAPGAFQILLPEDTPDPTGGWPLLYLRPGQEAAGNLPILREPLRAATVTEALEAALEGRSPKGPPPSAPRPRLLPTPSREAPAVLVVDDHEMNLQLSEALLRAYGCYTRLADGGRQALELLGERTFSLVLLDCQMPDMDGSETVARIRAREHPGRRTPVVAVTAHAFDADRERALAAGMDDYLVKPFTPEALEQMVTKWTGWRGPSTPGVLDPAVLAPLRGLKGPQGGPLVAELAALFLKDLPTRLRALDLAHAAREAEGLGRTAHALKAPAGSLGARELQALCLELEKLGRSGSLEGAEDLLGRIHSESSRVVEALEQELRRPAPPGGSGSGFPPR